MTIPSLLRKIFYNTSSTPKAAEEQRQYMTNHRSCLTRHRQRCRLDEQNQRIAKRALYSSRTMCPFLILLPLASLLPAFAALSDKREGQPIATTAQNPACK